MKRQNRLRRRRKDYPCDKISFPLISWLNGAPESDVHRMVRDLQSLNRLSNELDWSSPQVEQKQERLEYERLGESISLRMREFATYSAIVTDWLYMVAPGGRGSPLEFRRLRDQPYKLVRHPYSQSADPEVAIFHTKQMEPFSAFEEIVKRQWAWRLQICDVCQKWFCARTINQTYCPSPSRCRQKKYENSSTYKAWRTQYNQRDR